MSWQIEVKPTAAKQYLKLDRKTRMRIRTALRDLEQEGNPLFHKDIRPLTGRFQGDYHLRVEEWRLLFTLDRGKRIIYIYAIFPRDDVY